MRAVRSLAVASTLLAAACAEQAPSVAPEAASAAPHASTAETSPADGPWSRIVLGETGPGSSYAIYVPRDWKGDAVVYAHGFRDTWTPVDLRDQDGLAAFRDQLGAMGYAVAYSSYSENGLAVKDGAQRTHQLRGLLASVLGGQPARIFLAGHSLGAGVAIALAERYPTQYDGALVACGMVGGTRVQTQYLGHVRALFDHFYPNALPGSLLSYPAPPTFTPGDIGAIVAGNPLGLLAIASARQTPLPHVPGSAMTATLVGSLYGALNFHARGIDDARALTHGHTPFGNADTEYALGAAVVPPLAPVLAGLLAGANAPGGVERVTMAPDAEQYLAHNFTPTGELRIPVMAIHNMFDPGVPAFHVDSLKARAEAAGAGDMLTRRLLPSFGHCAIPTGTLTTGFADLVRWVETGVKAPGN